MADASKTGDIDLATLELFDKTEQWHKKYNEELEKVFNETVVNNTVVKEWVIFEAMSGYTKFGVGAGDGCRRGTSVSYARGGCGIKK